MRLVFGGSGGATDGVSIADAIYFGGTANGTDQAFYVAPAARARLRVRCLDDNTIDAPLEVTDIANPGICVTPIPQNPTIVQDNLVFTAITYNGVDEDDDCTATRHISSTTPTMP